MSEYAEPRLPAYDELPRAAHGGRSAWGLFGQEDSVGLLNLQTPDRVAAAARLIRSGEVYSLNAQATVPEPPLFRRGAVQHSRITNDGRAFFDDKLDNYYPQASSSMGTRWHTSPTATTSSTTGSRPRMSTVGARNTIGHWADREVSRAVRCSSTSTPRLAARASASTRRVRAISAGEDYDAAREAAGVDWQPGDVLLLHTGFLGWHVRQEAAVREAMAERGALRNVGLAHDEEMARYLWNARVAAVVSDNPSVEVWRADTTDAAFPFGYLHRVLIGQFGMALGELWWLEDLALSCRRDGRYEMFLTAAPINVPGGVGSPANALAIK